MAEKYLGEGELDKKARRGDKKAIAKLKKQKDKLKRSDKFKSVIRNRKDMTDDQKMKVMDYVGNNIFTEKELNLNKGGAVKKNKGGPILMSPRKQMACGGKVHK
jgi:hypothetical protein